MKYILKNITKPALAVIICIVAISSCNKSLERYGVPITSIANSLTINNFLKTDTAFTFFNAAVTKVGGVYAALLSDSSLATAVTLFAPTNNAFRAAGYLSTTAVSIMRIDSLTGLVAYSIIPGNRFLYTDFPTTFPNIQLPTAFGPGSTLPGTTIPFKFSSFPSRRATGTWLNATPITSFDAQYRNGVVHILSGLVFPPTATLKTLINNDPNLTFFSAAVIRGDSGQVGTSRIDSLLNYAVTNMTVFAPNDNAFKTLLFAQIYGGLLAQGVPAATASAQATALSSSPSVFSNPALFSTLTAATIRGIVVYHFLATLTAGSYQPNIRAFSVNFSATPTFYTTLVNNGVAVHPGINVQSIFAANGLSVTSMKVLGYGTIPPGGTPYSSPAATSTVFDKHGINGVYHIIDKVLLPQ